jgi:hypothetical protein
VSAICREIEGNPGGTALAEHGTVEAINPSTPTGSSLGTRVTAVVAIAGVLALGALIVRELMPHHTTTHATTTAPREEQETAPVTPAAPIARTARPVARPSATATAAAPKASGPAAPLAATIIAQVAADPESFAPSNRFTPPAGKDQVYSYEPLPPFNSTTLTRTRTNPAAWALDAMHGPKLTELGPEGGVHQAAMVKDSAGNETPWYVVDSGPLAPAYAVQIGRSIRVMSRAYLVENRADMPPEVAATLDK